MIEEGKGLMRISSEIGNASAGEEPSEVTLYFDEEGLDVLINRLRLIKERKTEHIHFFTPSWGMADDDLSEVKEQDDNHLVNHIKFMLLEK